ncbi:MAG: mechanosensitive ion channel [Bacteroidales bacterium]
MDISSWIPAPEKLTELLMTYGGKLLLALATLLIGLWLINRFARILRRLFELRSFEQTLQTFLISLIKITLKVLLVISVITMIGVQMTSFIALLGALGLAFGMALSGTLQNFAGGVMLLIFKPYKVGDFIEFQGFTGTVKEMQIFHTILNTPDKKTIIIPNGGISTGALVNYSYEPERRVDWTFGISYTDDIDQARSVVLARLGEDPRILKEPEPFVGVGNLGDSSVDLTTRVWVKSPDYWDVFFDINEKIKKSFDSQGITIPFPQTTVHLQK